MLYAVSDNTAITCNKMDDKDILLTHENIVHACNHVPSALSIGSSDNVVVASSVVNTLLRVATLLHCRYEWSLADALNTSSGPLTDGLWKNPTMSPAVKSKSTGKVRNTWPSPLVGGL